MSRAIDTAQAEDVDGNAVLRVQLHPSSLGLCAQPGLSSRGRHAQRRCLVNPGAVVIAVHAWGNAWSARGVTMVELGLWRTRAAQIAQPAQRRARGGSSNDIRLVHEQHLAQRRSRNEAV